MPVAAFTAYIFLTAFTPGPNNFMALGQAGKYGFRRSLLFCLGVFFGFLVLMSACAALSSMLFQTLPRIEPYLRALGAAYILFLAWVVWRDPGPGSHQAPGKPQGLGTGLIMQFVNVKVILYGLTALSTFVLPFHQSTPALAGFVLILSLVGLAGTVSWAWCGSLLQNLFTRHRRAVNAVLALSLIFCAVSSFF